MINGWLQFDRVLPVRDDVLFARLRQAVDEIRHDDPGRKQQLAAIIRACEAHTVATQKTSIVELKRVLREALPRMTPTQQKTYGALV